MTTSIKITKNKGGAPLGNTNSAKSKLFIGMVRKLIAHDELSLPENKRRLQMAASKLLNYAAHGEEWAVKMLADRLDGKAVQGVELTGADGEPVNFFNAATLRGMSPEKVAQLQTLLKEAGSLSESGQ
jgi:hypothetical protein